MSDKKPIVFPSVEQINEANLTGDRIAKQLEEENTVEGHVSPNEEAAAEIMRRRTEEQIRNREIMLAKNMKLAEDLEKTRDLQMEETKLAKVTYSSEPNKIISDNIPYVVNKSSSIDMFHDINQPQMHQAFDVIPLPSGGKTYPNKKKTVKVAYLTTSDENILTSPNLVESGDFLEILINRKLLEPSLRYKDLLPGDINAIMIWLRATGYGEMYSVQILDGKNKPFDAEINLSELKPIELSVNPDSDGLFPFKMPLSGDDIRFKLLTVGDNDEIDMMLESDKENNVLANNEPTYTLAKQIVEVNGNTDNNFISNYVENIRTMDAQKLRKYIESIDCGVDLRVNVETPGGESIKTFLPLNPSFFWPNSQL